MALDVAEFLWSKFLKSLQEAESELSGSIPISYFKAIKNLISNFKSIRSVVKEFDIMPERYSYSETIRLLYDLNDALAECRIFANECKELNKKLLLINPFAYIFIQKMKNRLDAIKRELEKLEAPREEIENPPEKTGPKLSSKVFGFDDEAKGIERLLFEEGGSSRIGFTAIGVVGIAGVGKTTLVQKVLERERVKEKFSPIIWLPFSSMREEEQQFSRFSFETCILDHLGHVLDGRIVGLGKLLERLNQLLSGKRYLLVFDDVWRRHINIEDRLWRGLPKGSGGAVIVTSRLAEVAEKLVEQNYLIHVKPSDKEICWCIFEDTIKNDKEFSSISHRETLEKIKEEIKDQCHGLPLAAKTLAEIIPEQIREIESNRFLKEMYIPDELLKPDLDVEPAVHIPECPVLVFVDLKNEQLGEKLFEEFCYRLNKKQVFAVLEENSDSKKKVKAQNPESVLKEAYGTLEKLKRKEYGFADEIQKRMKIIIVGGDAVANWIMGVICDLKLPESPSIVTIPQGTEDNIPLSFGWKEFNADRQSVTSFLREVTTAEPMKTDSWHILIKMKATQNSTAHPEISHSLHLIPPVHDEVMYNTDNPTLCGGFWNYFSLRVGGPRWYGAYCFHPTARTFSLVAKVEVMNHGSWELLNIPSGIKSIVCLNLPRFLGIPNPWGTPNAKKKRESDLNTSFIDDGLLEIIGLKDVLLPQNDRIRLDQVQGIRFKFIEGAAEVVTMSIDGTPWEKIPLDGIINIEISYNGQVNILAKPDCPAKRNTHDSSQPSAVVTGDDNNAQAPSKFGPTSTFKRPSSIPSP